jgi:peptidyl-prolyl cis-trans isomerase SurA
MNQRAYVLWLACAAQALALNLPAAAQGLRVAPPPGGFPAARPADNSPRSADYIVAVVNSEPITNNEVRSRMSRLERQFAQQGQGVPPRAQFARQLLERLITEKAQLQHARETGIKVDEALVDQAEQNLARQNQIEVAELRRRIAADGITPPQFREELRNQIVLTRLRERELESRVKINELDVDQFLREQQQASNDPATQEINLAHILVGVPENANEAQITGLRAKAQRVQERARAGEDFAKLAGEASDAPGAAANGGQVGLRTADRYPPLFVQAIQNLPEGGVSDIVRSGAGFHVIKVIEKRKGGFTGAVVQSRARHILLRPGPQLTETAAVQRLAELKRRVQAGHADFAQLAREFSQDASARNGGDLGWANPGMFVPEFEDAMASLAPGQIADPVISRFGVHLIQLLERRQATLTEREKRDLARNLVREKKLDEAYVQWAQDIRGRAYVEFREPPQ